MLLNMTKGTHEHTNTWTHIGLAAERVLTEIDKLKDETTGEQQEADRKNREADQDAHADQSCAVPLANRKLAL
jgi:hypothetical protein